MDIPIEIPGLNQMIPSLQTGRLVMVRGGEDQAKRYFAQYLGEMGKKQGLSLIYVTSREKDEVFDQYRSSFNDGQGITVLEEQSPIQWALLLREGTLLVIDSFSYLMMDADMASFRGSLEGMRQACRKNGSVVVLVVDRGMITPEKEAVTLHLVDGAVDFLTKETNEGLVRFIRIGRWMGNRVHDENIFYTFEEQHINVDLRKRVV